MSGEDLEPGNGGFAPDMLHLLALLHLNSTTSSTAVSTSTRTPVSAAARTKKRRSHSSSRYFRRSLSKRADLHCSTAGTAVNLRPSLHSPSSPPLQDPFITETTQVSDSSLPQFLKSLSPDNSKNDIISSFTTPSPLPWPLRHSLSGPIPSETHQKAAAQAVPPPLCLSKSDPITPEGYQVAAAADIPLQPPSAPRTLSRSPCSDPDSKDEYGSEYGEAVWIEQIDGGRGLIIHLRCPCGEGYGILVSGNTCYYKLM